MCDDGLRLQIIFFQLSDEELSQLPSIPTNASLPTPQDAACAPHQLVGEPPPAREGVTGVQLVHVTIPRPAVITNNSSIVIIIIIIIIVLIRIIMLP